MAIVALDVSGNDWEEEFNVVNNVGNYLVVKMGIGPFKGAVYTSLDGCKHADPLCCTGFTEKGPFSDVYCISQVWSCMSASPYSWLQAVSTPK